MPETPTPLDLDGVGWYEVTHPTAATTLLAYVHEDGSVYFPETNDGQTEFALAAARGHVHRLVRADDAEAEVARLTARPDPAWDEDAVVGDVAKVLREHGGWFADLPADEMDCCARAALAVVRDHLPVKPHRDALAAAIRLRHREMGSGVETVTVDDYESADATLDLWPGRSEAEVKAEALREFADAHRFPSDWIMFRRDDGTGVTVSDMLRAVADHLAAEGGDDRG